MTVAPDPFFALGLRLPPPGGRQRRKVLLDQIKAAILDGRLAPGLQLPGSRALAQHLGISRNSVMAVYELLLDEGYVVSRQGAGSFIAESRARLDERADVPSGEQRLRPSWRGQAPAWPPWPTGFPVSLRLGLPDPHLFPHDDWRRLAGRARRRLERTYGEYGDARGSESLRRAIAGHVSLTRAVACGPGDIVVTHGAQQAFDLIAKVLVEPGRCVVAMEEPGYPPMRATFAQAGAVLTPVPVDEEGLIVEAIPADASIICVTPSHQFPLGAAMSAARRQALLAFAERADAVIVEDDYDGEFRFEARPLDALQTLDRSGRVIYVGTFSKCLSPHLRLGFAVCPPWALGAMARAKQLSDWNCAVADQEILADFIAEGLLGRHVRRMNKIYGERRRLVLAGLHGLCRDWLTPLPAMAGLHIAARLADGLDAELIARRAANEGMLLRTIGSFATLRDPLQGFVLGYGAESEEMIVSGIGRLGTILASL
jgi:GntR family transcriptional regulator/MocR family aminotransferase